MEIRDHTFLSNQDINSISTPQKIQRKIKWMESLEPTGEVSSIGVFPTEVRQQKHPFLRMRSNDRNKTYSTSPSQRNLKDIHFGNRIKTENSLVNKGSLRVIEIVPEDKEGTSQLNPQSQQFFQLQGNNAQQQSHSLLFGLKSKKGIQSRVAAAEAAEINTSQRVAFLQDLISSIAQFPMKQASGASSMKKIGNKQISFKKEHSQRRCSEANTNLLENAQNKQEQIQDSKINGQYYLQQSQIRQSFREGKGNLKKGWRAALNTTDTIKNDNESEPHTKKQSSSKKIAFLNKISRSSRRISINEEIDKSPEEESEISINCFARKNTINFKNSLSPKNNKPSTSPRLSNSKNVNEYYQMPITSQKQILSPFNTHKPHFYQKVIKAADTTSRSSFDRTKHTFDESITSVSQTPTAQGYRHNQSQGNLLIQDNNFNDQLIKINHNEPQFYLKIGHKETPKNSNSTLHSDKMSFETKQLLEHFVEHIKDMQREYGNNKKISQLIYQVVCNIPYLVKMLFQEEKIVLREKLDFNYIFSFLSTKENIKGCLDSNPLNPELAYHINSGSERKKLITIEKRIKDDLITLNEKLIELIQKRFRDRFIQMSEDILDEHSNVQYLERNLEKNIADKNRVELSKGSHLLYLKHKYKGINNYTFLKKKNNQIERAQRPHYFLKEETSGLGDFKGIDKQAIQVSHQIDNLFDRIQIANNESQQFFYKSFVES